jgi:hypothetical protein
MSCAETLALLCASTGNYRFSPGVKSNDQLMRLEIAGLLSGLSDCEVNYALAKYCQDQKAFVRLVECVFDKYRTGCHIRDHEKVGYQVCLVSCYEMTSDSRCKRCYGTGLYANGVCRSCDGGGYLRQSGRGLAGLVGVTEWQWRRHWRAVYESLIRYLQDIDNAVDYHVYSRSL